jgi:hypothetical protein
VSDEREADGDHVMGNVDGNNDGWPEEREESVGVDDVNVAGASNLNFTRKTRTAAERREALGIIVRNLILFEW